MTTLRFSGLNPGERPRGTLEFELDDDGLDRVLDVLAQFEAFRDNNTESLRRCGLSSQPVRDGALRISPHVQTAQARSDRNTAETLQALKLDLLTRRAAAVLESWSDFLHHIDAWDGESAISPQHHESRAVLEHAIDELRKVVPAALPVTPGPAEVPP